MALRLGMRFDGFDPFGETIKVAQEAVAAGASGVWMAEHLGYREAAVSCMACAMKTEKAMVVPTAVMPYLWHPMPTAMQFATMAEAFPGRIGIAVSVGNLMNLRESGVTPTKPVRVIREYVEALRKLWAGETVEMEGRVFQLRGARLTFTPPKPSPIFVASTGPKVLNLSGRIADGVLFSGGLSLDFTRRCVALADEGVKQAGRDPSAVRKAGFVYFACSRNGTDAIETNRKKLAFLFRNRQMAENIKAAGIPIDQDAIVDAVAARDMDRAATHVPDEAIDAFGVAGTIADCRNSLEAYLATGLQEPVIQVSGTAEEKSLALDVIRHFTGG